MKNWDPFVLGLVVVVQSVSVVVPPVSGFGLLCAAEVHPHYLQTLFHEEEPFTAAHIFVLLLYIIIKKK